MTPRENEVGVILEPHEITFVQNAYVDCNAVRPSPIRPETDASEPIEFSLQQVNAIGCAVLVGASALRLSGPYTIKERLLNPFETRRVKERVANLQNFYHLLHDTVEESKGKINAPALVD